MTSKRGKSSNEMVVPRNKNKILCSTPEHRNDSPSRDSDSLCDSDSASPVPFLCTQDGTEGETDVIWNHYTPKSGNRAHFKNTTPLSRRSKKSLRPKVLEKPLPRRRAIRPSQKKNALLQELLELNQNLHEIIGNKAEKNSIPERDDSEDDIFIDIQEFSPKSGLRSNTCLRKNLLSSRFSKPEPEVGLDSDDSMNECLLKATQVVEENLLKDDMKPKNDVASNKNKCTNSSFIKIDQDSMDAILNSIKFESPCAKRVKKCNSPQLVNDSFDGFVGNLNDSALERLTQMPTKPRTTHEPKTKKTNELYLDFNGSFSKSFSRHSSMPESPSVPQPNKPSTSGMAFGRYSSMPMDKNQMDPSDSPIRCTPDEIKKKHQMAREKLLAKRQLPFTSLPCSNTLPSIPEKTSSNKYKFQPKVPSEKAFLHSKLSNNVKPNCNNPPVSNQRSNSEDIKAIIEKKRQEALMKLRLRKQTQAKT
ncbi:PREDICTED: uncharacterized protein LOC106120158 isoform X1 [Papilio xuthus]|uniref:Uncharacterized protein LOC106120158 isoform X1 n=1 Tax=Papilio xuthus TaxID=66420 RepID=A0AAJ7EBR3_PAPXU|nr:PREDICTED: uncharacterized protein LOC106120158 isoform X1 [Papilio xuthus]